MSDKNGWIGVDLDGTLAHYDGWKGIQHIGKPVPAMLERVKGWITEGKTVKIFTARVYRELEAKRNEDPQAADEALSARCHIEDWLIEVGLGDLEITCIKDMQMVALYDDRCVQVELNTGRLIGQ